MAYRPRRAALRQSRAAQAQLQVMLAVRLRLLAARLVQPVLAARLHSPERLADRRADLAVLQPSPAELELRAMRTAAMLLFAAATLMAPVLMDLSSSVIKTHRISLSARCL